MQLPGANLARSLHFGGIRRNACTRSKRLITRRSQVQILPPLLRKALVRAPFAGEPVWGWFTLVWLQRRLGGLENPSQPAEGPARFARLDVLQVMGQPRCHLRPRLSGRGHVCRSLAPVSAGRVI